MIRNVISIACAGLVFGCGDTSEHGQGALDQAGQPITGGKLVPVEANVGPDGATVRIQTATDWCSAIKIGSLRFMTAAHCVNGLSVNGQVLITNRIDGILDPPQYTKTVTAIYVHPSYKFRYNFNAVAYDFALFDVASTTAQIPSYTSFRSSWVDPDRTGTITAYGCDQLNTSHDDKKQYAIFDLVDEAEILAGSSHTPEYTADLYAHAMVALGTNPEVCSGDSGSPFFVKSGSTWYTSGVSAQGGDEGISVFMRYGNVRTWIGDPRHNVFLLGFQGSLLNKFAGRCMGVNGASTADGAAIKQFNCDGRLGDLDNQSWLLASGLGAGNFNIVNGKSGKCLDLETIGAGEGAPIIQRTCLNFSTQVWRFMPTSDPNYFQIKNHYSGRCIAPPSLSQNHDVELRQYACTTAAPAWRSQAWLMHR